MAHIFPFMLLPTLTSLLLNRSKRRFKPALFSWNQWIWMSDFQPLHHGHNITFAKSKESFTTIFFHTTAGKLCQTGKLEKNRNLLGDR